MSPDYMHPYAPSFAIEAEHALLLVVDMQYATASRSHGLGRLLASQGRAADGAARFDRIEDVVVPGIQRLLAAFRERGLQIAFATLGSERADFSDMPEHLRGLARATGSTRGNREREILAELAPLPGELVVDKTTASAFASSTLDALLRERAVRDLVVCGVSTNSCVESTAREAADRGFRATIVGDACGAADRSLHEAALISFGRLFGRVATIEDVLLETQTALR